MEKTPEKEREELDDLFKRLAWYDDPRTAQLREAAFTLEFRAIGAVGMLRIAGEQLNWSSLKEYANELEECIGKMKDARRGELKQSS